MGRKALPDLKMCGTVLATDEVSIKGRDKDKMQLTLVAYWILIDKRSLKIATGSANRDTTPAFQCC